MSNASLASFMNGMREAAVPGEALVRSYCSRAVSVSTGREVWRRRTGGRVRASPVLNRDQDMLYFGSWDGHFYCVQSNDSTPVWNYSTSLCPVGPKHADWVPHSCPIASNPAMDANSTFVLFGADDYKLHALDSSPTDTSSSSARCSLTVER